MLMTLRQIASEFVTISMGMVTNMVIKMHKRWDFLFSKELEFFLFTLTFKPKAAIEKNRATKILIYRSINLILFSMMTQLCFWFQSD